MQPMNILYIGPLFPHPGGSGITCSQLFAEIARLGHTVRAFSAITDEAYRNGDPIHNVYPEIHVTRYLTPFFEVDPGNPFDPSFYDGEARHFHRYVEAIPENERPDVIVAGRESISPAMPALAAKLDVPWVLRLAGSVMWEVIRGTYPASRLALLRERMRSADLVITQARHMREFTDKLGLPHVAIVPNLVDLKLFAPRSRPLPLCRALGIEPGNTVVLHASNFKPVKRARDIVNAASAVLPANPDLVFVMAGDGPCREEVEQESRNNGTHSRFRFPGWVDYTRMPEYLAMADIVVSASADEQQSRMYLETQATARVLVASDIPAARELVEHSHTGLLFRKENTDDLAAQITRAARSPELRVRIGGNARQRAEVHSIDRVARQFAAELFLVVERSRQLKSTRVASRLPAASMAAPSG
jgi:glycosyltransferase involved in cell wall biosynthesis